MPQPIVRQLTNGFTVAIDAIPGACSVALNLQMRAGSRYDPENAQGMAHFAEHMLFKGAGDLASDAQAEALENVGVDINAWTSLDHMAIDLHSLPEHLSMGVDIVAQMIRNPWLHDEDVKSERDVVLSEMDGLGDDDLLIEIAHDTAYPGHPYSRRTIGRRDHLHEITGSSMRTWLQDRLRASDMVLSVAGGVDPDTVIEVAERAFGGMPTVTQADPGPAPVFHPGRATERPRMGQGILALMWDSPALGACDRDAWSLAASMLGGSPSSRLFRRLRQELGLCYEVQAWSHSSRDTGQTIVNLATDPAKVKRAYREVLACLEIAGSSVTQAELDRARSRRRASLLMSQDDVGKRSERLAHTLLDQGRTISVAEILERTNAVTLEQIRDVLACMVQAPRVVANVGGGPTATA